MVSFTAASVAVLSSPYVAAAAVALLVVAVFCFQQSLFAYALELLALAPTWMMFSSKPAEASSTTLIGQQIDDGDPVRRVAITAFFLIGLALLARKPGELRRVNMLVWIASYIALAFASLLWSQDGVLTARRVIVLVSVSILSVSAACVYYGRRPDGHVVLVRAICWTSAFASLLVLGLAIYRGDFRPYDFAWRLGSTGHENQISQVAAVGFLAAVLTGSQKKIWQNRFLLFFVLGITAAVVVLTKSRTTWLGLIFGIAMAGLCTKRARGKKLLAMAALTIIIGVLANSFAFQQLWKRGESDQELGTASGRTDLWQKVWPQVSKELWLGYGAGAFWSPRTIGMLAGHWAATSAHNGYLDLVAELGIVGLAINLMLLFVSWRNALRLLAFPEYRDVGLFLLAFTFMIVLINASESFLHDIEYYPMIVFLVCSLFVSHRLSVLQRAGLHHRKDLA